MRKDLHEENRLSWNAATVAHNSHRGDQAAFFRNGGTTLRPEELALLGDLQGRLVAHLQCNSGQDTLSLARMGAQVVGVDISEAAIEFARQLSQDAGIPAAFERADVYDWLEETASSTRRFDLAYCSYGALVWLSDIQTWARGVADILRPGGSLVVIDTHPVAHMFEPNGTRVYPYTTQGEPLSFEEGVGDYVAELGEGWAGMAYEPGIQDFTNTYRHHEFNWGLGEIVTALLASGLILTSLQEYFYDNGGPVFEGMQQGEKGWYLPAEQPNFPLLFSLTARKPVRV